MDRISKKLYYSLYKYDIQSSFQILLLTLNSEGWFIDSMAVLLSRAASKLRRNLLCTPTISLIFPKMAIISCLKFIKRFYIKSEFTKIYCLPLQIENFHVLKAPNIALTNQSSAEKNREHFKCLFKIPLCNCYVK